MKRTLTIAILVACLASTLDARLGETRDEVIRRYGQITSQSEVHIEFRGTDKVIIVGIDEAGRSCLEIHTFKESFNPASAWEVVNTVAPTPHWDLIKNNLFRSADGRCEFLVGPTALAGYQWSLIIAYTDKMEAAIAFASRAP